MALWPSACIFSSKRGRVGTNLGTPGDEVGTNGEEGQGGEGGAKIGSPVSHPAQQNPTGPRDQGIARHRCDRKRDLTAGARGIADIAVIARRRRDQKSPRLTQPRMNTNMRESGRASPACFNNRFKMASATRPSFRCSELRRAPASLPRRSGNGETGFTLCQGGCSCLSGGGGKLCDDWLPGHERQQRQQFFAGFAFSRAFACACHAERLPDMEK